ncbi:thiamine pyrophosphate-dependent dehydrogenase E1 component subunit alpha [Candidatus Methylospira mobilis]|uniref:Thiamine pyrophosphate-dependent dehydrogenase E1 component subunit alpha n=1 Tax=Candidatus Methylospira mobilis TaxID=1808979 RepID=A0A5Q0BFG4_9GAMM|nr:thiamine pyrophosphate-dependent dehydrogenase E1 component subunit alpha [Candidatus Methylospira mobilis]QFY41872.1 thiamine pyrophosphate-dependent dehydrogenase E1 component subunit alpha [Candidatus Methylospira mobilis]WNV06749.1 thiamine pyrophosphate-dependent dehydrogenase E1 component subunit alpha [Candidatus Methylospira mobilis]
MNNAATTGHIKSLYRTVLRIRRVEEAIAEHYAAQEMRCPVHLSIGQEAVAAGVCATLASQDGVFSNHRAHAHYLAKGGDLTAMLAELYGKAEGCCKGVGGSMHMIDLAAGFLGAVPIVGATVPLAVGAAWAASLRGENRIIAVFFGEGTFEEGAVFESINFAALHRLPVLFVCENNLYACYTQLSTRQPKRPIHMVAAASGCKAMTADGNDAMAVFEAAAGAVAALRAGSGPVFIECPTYRWKEHCGPNSDDALGYRPETEIAKWIDACPVKRLATALGATPEGQTFVANAEREIAEEIATAFIAAQAGAVPQYEDLPRYLYA